MQTRPLVSIVVPSFQQGRFLGACLRSLARQTYAPLEVLVHDNLSTDGSEALLEAFRGRFSIVRRRDVGQTDALIQGFRSSKGRILGWLNADDMLMPDAVERAVVAFEGSDQPDLIYGHCALLSEAGQFLGYFADARSFDRTELLGFSDFVPQPGTLFRREAFEAAGGLDPGLEYTMDWDLWCRLARAGARFRFIDEVTSGFRLHRASKTSLGGWSRYWELLRVNLRHAPLGIPWLSAAHLYTRLPRHLRPGRRALRWLYERIPGRPSPGSGIVHGLDAWNRVREGTFRVRFPLDAAAAESALSVRGATRLEVTLSGRPPSRLVRNGDALVATWSLRDHPRTHIDLEASIAADTAPAEASFLWWPEAHPAGAVAP